MSSVGEAEAPPKQRRSPRFVFDSLVRLPTCAGWLYSLLTLRKNTQVRCSVQQGDASRAA